MKDDKSEFPMMPNQGEHSCPSRGIVIVDLEGELKLHVFALLGLCFFIGAMQTASMINYPGVVAAIWLSLVGGMWILLAVAFYGKNALASMVASITIGLFAAVLGCGMGAIIVAAVLNFGIQFLVSGSCSMIVVATLMVPLIRSAVLFYRWSIYLQTNAPQAKPNKITLRDIFWLVTVLSLFLALANFLARVTRPPPGDSLRRHPVAEPFQPIEVSQQAKGLLFRPERA